MPEAPHPSSLLETLARITGPQGLLTGADAAPMLTDWRNLYHGAALAVLRPGSTEELSACVRACVEARVPMVPQGGNTSMVGGATPDESGRQIVVALTRMNRVRSIDTTDMTMVAEAGLVLKSAQDAARDAGGLFPLSLGAEGSATIGGVIEVPIEMNGAEDVAWAGMLRTARRIMEGTLLVPGRIWAGGARDCSAIAPGMAAK